MCLSNKPFLIRFLKSVLPYMREGQEFTFDELIPSDIQETEDAWELENGLVEEFPALESSGVVIRLQNGRFQVGSNIKDFTRQQIERLEATGFVNSFIDEAIFQKLKDHSGSQPE